MTNRNKRGARFNGPRKRTGRKVWVNGVISPGAVTPDAQTSLTLLDPALDFMKFDTTILRVVISDFSLTFTKSVAAGIITARIALQIAPTTMDADDFQDMFTESIGAPWMYTEGVTAFVADNALGTFTFSSGVAAPIKAERRFRENDSTLFMLFGTTISGGSFTGGTIRGLVRTLLHIP